MQNSVFHGYVSLPKDNQDKAVQGPSVAEVAVVRNVQQPWD